MKGKKKEGGAPGETRLTGLTEVHKGYRTSEKGGNTGNSPTKRGCKGGDHVWGTVKAGTKKPTGRGLVKARKGRREGKHP